MKNALIILATILVIGCSKKDDPEPIEPKKPIHNAIDTRSYNYFIDGKDSLWASGSGTAYKAAWVKYYPYNQTDHIYDSTRYLKFPGFNYGNYQHIRLTTIDISGPITMKDSVNYLNIYPYYLTGGKRYVLNKDHYTTLIQTDLNYKIDALEKYSFSLKLDTATFVNTLDSTDKKIISFWLLL